MWHFAWNGQYGIFLHDTNQYLRLILTMFTNECIFRIQHWPNGWLNCKVILLLYWIQMAIITKIWTTTIRTHQMTHTWCIAKAKTIVFANICWPSNCLDMTIVPPIHTLKEIYTTRWNNWNKWRFIHDISIELARQEQHKLIG